MIPKPRCWKGLIPLLDLHEVLQGNLSINPTSASCNQETQLKHQGGSGVSRDFDLVSDSATFYRPLPPFDFYSWILRYYRAFLHLPPSCSPALKPLLIRARSSSSTGHICNLLLFLFHQHSSSCMESVQDERKGSLFQAPSPIALQVIFVSDGLVSVLKVLQGRLSQKR